jgi:hypothetical protein
MQSRNIPSISPKTNRTNSCTPRVQKSWVYPPTQSKNWMQTKHITRNKQDKLLHAKGPNKLSTPASGNLLSTSVSFFLVSRPHAQTASKLNRSNHAAKNTILIPMPTCPRDGQASCFYVVQVLYWSGNYHIHAAPLQSLPLMWTPNVHWILSFPVAIGLLFRCLQKQSVNLGQFPIFVFPCYFLSLNTFPF